MVCFIPGFSGEPLILLLDSNREIGLLISTATGMRFAPTRRTMIWFAESTIAIVEPARSSASLVLPWMSYPLLVLSLNLFRLFLG